MSRPSLDAFGGPKPEVGAPETIYTLFKSEWHLNHINGTQVGKKGPESDGLRDRGKPLRVLLLVASGKDAGPLDYLPAPSIAASPTCTSPPLQECMIGYSDSGKDAGRMAAAWALFETQEKIVQARVRNGAFAACCSLAPQSRRL